MTKGNYEQKYTRKRKKRTVSESVVFAFASIILIFWAVSRAVPIIFGINVALMQTGNDFLNNPVALSLFNRPAWSNFALAFTEITANEVSFIRMTFNSLFFAVVPNIVATFFTAAMGYIVSKYNKYRIMGFIYGFILIIQFIPIYGNLPAQYRLFTKLGFLNSYTIVIASFGISFGNFLYMYAFFKTVPWAYAESAFIDGAGHWRTFLKVMFPQALPSIFVLFLMSFIGSWNDFQTCLMFYSEKLPTLSYGIYAFYQKTIYMANQPVYMAGCLLVCIPTTILFIIFQEKIMTTMIIGGLKG